MMHIGSFAAKALGLFALGLFPQDKPAPAQTTPAKPTEVKPGTTVIIEGKKLDKPTEGKKVELIQLEGKKIEIREVEGKPNEAKKVVEYRIQAQGEGKSENGVITIKVVGEPVQTGAKTENRTVTVTDVTPSGEIAKPGAKTVTRAFVVEGHPVQTPGASKVIKIVIGDDGKVIRTETQDVKGQQSQTIELRGVLKSLENANKNTDEAIKKAMEAVQGEKMEIRRIQIVGPDLKHTETKPLTMTPGVNSATATTGTITVTQSSDAKKLDAILNRLEKIEKTLEELKSKGK